MPKLVNIISGSPIQIGDTIETFRGDVVKISALYPYDGMRGKVAFENWPGLYYPSIIDAEFV